jgi:hypothetical protein
MKRTATQYQGNYVIEAVSGDIYAADRLKVAQEGIQIFLGPIQTGTAAPTEIKAIHELEKTGSLDLSRERSKIAATILVLENLIEEYSNTKGVTANAFTQQHAFCIFGSCSLALTLLPERMSEDIDIIGPEDFVDYINQVDLPYTELSVEVLPPTLNQLLGNWRDRTTQMLGYHKTKFLVLHPLDTLSQKLLRYSEEKFETKDKPDITALLSRLRTPKETLKYMLTENAMRYYPNPLGKDAQNLAIERNTSWFCERFLECSYEQIVRAAIDRLQKVTERIGKAERVQSLPDFQLQDKIKLHPKKPNDFGIS